MSGVIERNNVNVRGAGDRAIVFASRVRLRPEHVAVRGSGVREATSRPSCSIRSAQAGRISRPTTRPNIRRLSGYADDLVEIGRELELKDAIFVGHSVSSMIGVLAAQKAPGMFGKLVLVGPSPGTSTMTNTSAASAQRRSRNCSSSSKPTTWAGPTQMAPAIMGNPDRPELGEELTNSFCRTDPEIAKAFARVTFTSDNRKDLADVAIPTLILQCSEDIIASDEVGEFVNRKIPGSRMIVLEATGHCPNLSAPKEVVDAMRTFV